MKKAIVKLESLSPYSQSKYIDPGMKKKKELHRDFEERIWRERFHHNQEGEIYIPATQFTGCIKNAARYLSIQIPGKGKSTYTKHFDAGVMAENDLYLGININQLDSEIVIVPSDGKRGGTTRVPKIFGIVHEWKGEVVFGIMDEIITKDVFEYVLRNAGVLIGIGRFRPMNRGSYGRFGITSIEWEDKVLKL